jgi:transposase-like protein
MSGLHLVKKRGKRKKLERISQQDIEEGRWKDAAGEQIDSSHMLISMMLPPAVKAFFSEMEAEVGLLCGQRYQHDQADLKRWGAQAGSIILGGQKVAIQRPRVRDVARGQEVLLDAYRKFQDPGIFNQTIFTQAMKHVSQRDYEQGMPKLAQSFGVKKSSVSRAWIKASAAKVEKLLSRDIGLLDIVAVFIDGKRFAEKGVVVALGVASDGKKYVLGIFECSTESSDACISLLDDLQRRGLPDRGLLFVVDGGSGLNKALDLKYDTDKPASRRALRVRCYVHKWRNLAKVLNEDEQAEAAPLFWALRDATDRRTAIDCSAALEGFLKRANRSALNSFLEAKDDLLRIHDLRVSANLRRVFATTNPIESLNSMLEEDLRRVKRWHDSEHFQRWMAAGCLKNEERMRRIRGFRGLPALVVRLKQLCVHGEDGVDHEDRVA